MKYLYNMVTFNTFNTLRDQNWIISGTGLFLATFLTRKSAKPQKSSPKWKNVFIKNLTEGWCTGVSQPLCQCLQFNWNTRLWCSHLKISECPQKCTTVKKPVCGSNLKTYPNKCLLKLKSCKNPKLKLKVKFKGKCSKKEAQNGSNKKGMKRFWMIMFDLIGQIHDFFISPSYPTSHAPPQGLLSLLSGSVLAIFCK